MQTARPPFSAEDLELVNEAAGPIWEGIDGARILVTGASGFFGGWMLESLLFAAKRRNLGIDVIAISRSARRFRAVLPHLAGDARLAIREEDATRLSMPAGPIDFIIHSMVPHNTTPLPEMDLFFRLATGALLKIAGEKSAKGFLLCSTGAVYLPKNPPAAFSENDARYVPEGPISYGRIRRGVEDQCRAAWVSDGVAVKIARGFTFVGPGLPLDGPFAAGNFLRDALAGGPISVRGDGSAVRSYQYAADMAAWLWSVLVNAPCGTTANVGSPDPVSIRQLAELAAGIFRVPVHFGGRKSSGTAPDYYVPSKPSPAAWHPHFPATKLEEALLRAAKHATVRPQ